MSTVPRKRRRALIVAAGLLCCALTLFAWLRPAPPPHLQVAPVARGSIEQVVEATGTLKPSQLVSVGAQVSGRIDTLHVKLGDKVKAGDPIADIDSRTQRNALLSAQAAQRTARANRDALATDLRQFELTLHRQQQLVASQLVARADFDTAKAKVDATREQVAALDGEVARRQTDVDVAQTNLEYTRITAPHRRNRTGRGRAPGADRECGAERPHHRDAGQPGRDDGVRRDLRGRRRTHVC